jgi:hypothetical protein
MGERGEGDETEPGGRGDPDDCGEVDNAEFSWVPSRSAIAAS